MTAPPLQRGLILVAVLLFVVPAIAWSRGLPLGLLMVVAGFFALRALDARSRQVALWLIGAGVLATLLANAWLDG
jgi:uncharacterized membrane protein